MSQEAAPTAVSGRFGPIPPPFTQSFLLSSNKEAELAEFQAQVSPCAPGAHPRASLSQSAPQACRGSSLPWPWATPFHAKPPSPAPDRPVLDSPPAPSSSASTPHPRITSPLFRPLLQTCSIVHRPHAASTTTTEIRHVGTFNLQSDPDFGPDPPQHPPSDALKRFTTSTTETSDAIPPCPKLSTRYTCSWPESSR